MAAADLPTSLSLLERVRGREPDAWQKLVHLYGPLVATWARFWGVSGADADDLAQEVFKSVAQGVEGFRRGRPGDSFRSWLKTVTRNELIDLRRRSNRSPTAKGGSDAFSILNQIPDPEPDLPSDSPSDLSGLYRRALELVRGEFEPKTWQAFWRVVVDDRPTAAAAAELGLTSSAVRMAKSRVLRRLREEVGDLVDVPGGKFDA